MRVTQTIDEFRQARQSLPAPLGFVPTMGYLHEGHVSLIRRARDECGSVVVSIFVNPTQFGPGEDFEQYPRDAERDLALCEAAGSDIVFMPQAAEMYPPGATTRVTVGGITEVLEGSVRPGHFEGVTTVVAKLFHIVSPDRAYFGQKDAQQLAVVRRMVTDLDMNLEVIACETVREHDGLALSSRNVYLSAAARIEARCLSEALFAARDAHGTGERDAAKLRALMTHIIQRRTLPKIDYVSLADSLTLREVTRLERPVLASLAVRFGATRLIDNILLTAVGEAPASLDTPAPSG